jgi:repressor LexA
MKPLSFAHEKIARAILTKEQREEPAFVSDLVRTLSYAAESSLTATLRLMERKGLISLQGGGERGKARVVLLTPMGRHALGAGGLPLLGTIPAGPLSEALADNSRVVEVKDLFPYREGDFLLEVRGDSMVGDGIFEGDKVLLRPNVEAKSGEIAAVLAGDYYEATLKRVILRPQTGEVTLRASNPKYPDLTLKAENIQIAGVFRGLIRHGAGIA